MTSLSPLVALSRRAARKGARRDSHHHHRRDWGQQWLGIGMVAPIIVLFSVFGLYPLVRTIQLSTTDWNGLSAVFRYIGFQNYVAAFHDGIWWQSLGHGLQFALVALTIMDGLGLLLAIGVNQKIRGKTIYRVLFYLPPVMSGVVVAIVWKWLYQPYGGAINGVLKTIGLGSLQHAWLADSRTALWAVSLASVWQGVGTPFLLFLAALQGIPEEQFEAAHVDGASSWQSFRYITFPNLLPTIGMISVLTFLGAMQMFTLVMPLTNGGPGYATEVPVLHIYRAAFGLSQFGYACALSVIFALMLLIISLATIRLTRRPS